VCLSAPRNTGRPVPLQLPEGTVPDSRQRRNQPEPEVSQDGLHDKMKGTSQLITRCPTSGMQGLRLAAATWQRSCLRACSRRNRERLGVEPLHAQHMTDPGRDRARVEATMSNFAVTIAPARRRGLSHDLPVHAPRAVEGNVGGRAITGKFLTPTTPKWQLIYAGIPPDRKGIIAWFLQGRSQGMNDAKGMGDTTAGIVRCWRVQDISAWARRSARG